MYGPPDYARLLIKVTPTIISVLCTCVVQCIIAAEEPIGNQVANTQRESIPVPLSKMESILDLAAVIG